MTKSDLKTGMLVQTKEGNWYVFIGEIFLNLSTMNNLLLRYFDNDLIYVFSSDFNIVKVANISYIGNVFRAYKENRTIEKVDGFKVIWQRESEKETQLNTLISKLKIQLEEAQKELANIKK